MQATPKIQLYLTIRGPLNYPFLPITLPLLLNIPNYLMFSSHLIVSCMSLELSFILSNPTQFCKTLSVKHPAVRAEHSYL